MLNFFRSKLNLIKKPYIKIKDIDINLNKVTYTFETSNDLDEYFIKKEMFVEYIGNNDLDLHDVPKSILIIPLITNLLPFVWLGDLELIINELDLNFYNSIDNIKKGYENMYKNAKFKGKISVKKLITNEYEPKTEYLSLFSYGVDSLNTVIKYIDHKPILLTLWGADVRLNYEVGWYAVKDNIDKFSNEYGLNNFFIKSDFREFMNYNKLFNEFSDLLNNNGNWWYAVQHGIALIGQTSILSFIFKVKMVLIASTYSYSDNELLNLDIIPCASSPEIDNHVKFASCDVFHDSYECTRADKIDNIIRYANENNVKFNMHVCWYSSHGINCNICEKCARTLMYIMAVKEDPNNYGFEVNEETLKRIESDFKKVFFENENVGGWSIHQETMSYWKHNQMIFKQDEDYWKDTSISWIFDIDFDEIIEKLK